MKKIEIGWRNKTINCPSFARSTPPKNVLITPDRKNRLISSKVFLSVFLTAVKNTDSCFFGVSQIANTNQKINTQTINKLAGKPKNLNRITYVGARTKVNIKRYCIL